MPIRKAALVTGAGKNIGRAVALGLAEDGFDVAINGASDVKAAESVAELDAIDLSAGWPE